MLKIGIEYLEHTQALFECLCSAPLLVDSLPEAVCFDRSLFSNGERIVDTKLNYSQKLGHLYEDALEKMIIESENLELLGKGIQIFNENKITLGELDFLLTDLVSEKLIHLELAVKFYLIQCKDGETLYPGPDPRDNWLNKLKRLREHQLMLPKMVSGKKLLDEKYGITEVESEQLIYGKLFDHYRAENKPCPPAMNPNATRGKWKYLSEWKRDSKAQKVVIIPKHLWPVMITNELVMKLNSVSREEFMKEAVERCTMVWDDATCDGQFISPDTWGRDDEVR